VSNLIKLVNREMPEATIEVDLAEWPLTSAQNIGTIRAGAGWEIHVPSKVNPFEVAKVLEFDVKPGDDPDALKLVIIQGERKWGPLFVEEPGRVHVVFREIADEDDMNYGWEWEHESWTHFLSAGVIASFGAHSEGGAPISSDYSGGIVDLGNYWFAVTQIESDFEYVIAPVPENQAQFLTYWIRNHNVEELFIVLAAECNWSDEAARDSFEEAREIVAMDLAKIHLEVEPTVARECIEILTADNPVFRALLLAIEGEFSPASALVMEALETASEQESAHPIFELESNIANA
jgi:hypothetical protein